MILVLHYLFSSALLCTGLAMLVRRWLAWSLLSHHLCLAACLTPNISVLWSSLGSRASSPLLVVLVTHSWLQHYVTLVYLCCCGSGNTLTQYWSDNTHADSFCVLGPEGPHEAGGRDYLQHSQQSKLQRGVSGNNLALIACCNKVYSKVPEDFTITEKAPTRAIVFYSVLNVRVLIGAFSVIVKS